jgi:isopenicillin N synthase-like dioxygenase
MTSILNNLKKTEHPFFQVGDRCSLNRGKVLISTNEVSFLPCFSLELVSRQSFLPSLVIWNSPEGENERRIIVSYLFIFSSPGLFFMASHLQPTIMAAADQDIKLEESLKITGLGSALARDDGIVPVIDLSVGTEQEIVDQLWQAATQVGFFSLTGHGIPQTLIDKAFDESQRFFDQPLQDKTNQSPLDMSINCGFEYYAQVRPSTGVADQKESLQITARENAMDGRWPSDHMESAATQLLNASHALANKLLDMLQPLAVPHAAPQTLSKSHTLWNPDGQCTLRFLHYPPQDEETTAKLLQEGYWRAGPHTDWANLTLLYQRLGQAGLECCANPRTGNPSEMYWTKVNPVEGAIAVNIGDMLARWSDGRLYSNLHRVRLPQDATKSRYSYVLQVDQAIVPFLAFAFIIIS